MFKEEKNVFLKNKLKSNNFSDQRITDQPQDVVLPDHRPSPELAEAELLSADSSDLSGGRASVVPDHGQADGRPQLRAAAGGRQASGMHQVPRDGDGVAPEPRRLQIRDAHPQEGGHGQS